LAIVVLQYWLRRPAIPRALFVAGFALWTVAAAVTRSPAHSIQSWLSTRAIAPHDFQITLREHGPRTIWQGLGWSYNWRAPAIVHLEIPIRVADLRSDDRLFVNRLQFTPTLGISTIRSSDNTIHDVVSDAGWLRLFVDGVSYASVANQRIDLAGTADLTLFVHTQTVLFQHVPVTVPNVGVCSPYPVGCYTALPRASMEVDVNDRFLTYVIVPNQTYDPFPTSLGLTPFRHIPTAPGELIVRKPVAWFTRSFEFRDIRLADFVR